MESRQHQTFLPQNTDHPPSEKRTFFLPHSLNIFFKRIANNHQMKYKKRYSHIIRKSLKLFKVLRKEKNKPKTHQTLWFFRRFPFHDQVKQFSSAFPIDIPHFEIAQKQHGDKESAKQEGFLKSHDQRLYRR
jgi:hypothetical protein